MKIKKRNKKAKLSSRAIALTIQTAQHAQALANVLGVDPDLPDDAREHYRALLDALTELHKLTNNGNAPAALRPKRP
jgi:soluble cytochrome b562